MNRQPHSSTREIIVANALREVVSELRMVDIADYIAFIRMERLGSIADIVESAAELYFMPGTVRMGHGCEALVTWADPPRVLLDLELHPRGATVFLHLTLCDESAGLAVNYVSFENPSNDPEENSRRLGDALEDARIRAARPLRLAG